MNRESEQLRAAAIDSAMALTERGYVPADDAASQVGQTLPPPQMLAIGHMREVDRPLVRAFFLLDARMARSALSASEPIFAQMRLSWWRDALAKQDSASEERDPLLVELMRLGHHFEPGQLVDLIDAWEQLACADPHEFVGALENLIVQRGRGFGTMAVALECAGASNDAAHCGELWARADLAELTGATEEVHSTRSRIETPVLPRRLRGMAILGTLGARVLARGRPGLLGGRSDALVALRIGLLGR